jgi:penicillin-binding protein A
LTAKRLARPLAWGFAALAAAGALLAWLSLSASADLQRGRERLLAGDTAAARVAFGRARRWPRHSAAARAGEIAAAARAGSPAVEPVSLSELETLGPEALLLAALAEGRLDAAGALADLARRAGHPLGRLYAAAIAFDRGDEKDARALAAGAPLASRGLGARLRRALFARDAGAVTLVLDRRGELAATVGRDGRLEPEPEAAALLAGVLPKLPALPAGDAARLSVDLDLSRLAREALGGHRGSIVLVDVHSGAVLAAVSDDRTAATEGAAAFTQRREPASIAKVLTAAAAFRAGLDADAEIRRMTCTGVERYGGQPLWCAWPAGPLEGLDHALAVSCNIAFANLGVRLGAERIVAEYRLWGFDEPGGLLGAAGRVHTRPITPRQVADLSDGLTLVDVTPLHAALLAAVVANDGRLPEPRLLTGPCGRLGLSDGPTVPPTGRDVLDPAVARRLRRAMQAVAEVGTGAGLAPAGLPVAMKTGTAAEPGRGYHVNYIGMAPLPYPAIAFCVRVTNVGTSPGVNAAAREVTRRLLSGLADR